MASSLNNDDSSDSILQNGITGFNDSSLLFGDPEQAKEDLWHAIQTRRMRKGLDLIQTGASSQINNEKEITESDLHKRLVRREKNKEAAKRSRKRRKLKLNNLKMQIQEIEKANVRIELSVKLLKSEKDQIIKALQTHQCFCL